MKCAECADLTYSDDYTADAVANRYYTGQQGGQVIQPTLNPIATSYQPQVSPVLQLEEPWHCPSSLMPA